MTPQQKWNKEHPENICENGRRWRMAHLEQTRKAARDYGIKNAEKIREKRRKYCEANPEKVKAQYRAHNVKLKTTVISGYGGKCQWPDGCDITDIDMLQIDHINGDGYEQRKQIKPGSFYLWIITNNYPKSLRVLCANHNWKHKANLESGKRFGAR